MAPKDDTKHYDSIPSDDSTAETPADDLKESIAAELPTNEYVLNVAFYSFIGFVLVQSVFACAAHSQSMLADAQAMSVDAMTYLCNLTAERIKNRPFSERELILPDCTRAHNRKVERLLLELVPPLISVATLITVTVMTLREALGVLLRSDKDDDADDVSVPLMLFFSGANLLLDIVNVTCFARAQSAYGFDVDVVKGHTDLGGRKESACRNCTSSEANETSLLLAMEDDTDQSNEASKRPGFNLNMCSAWTVCFLLVNVLLAWGIFLDYV